MLTHKATKFLLVCAPLFLLASLKRSNDVQRNVLSTIVDWASDAAYVQRPDQTEEEDAKTEDTRPPSFKLQDELMAAAAPGADLTADNDQQPGTAPCAILFVGLPRSYQSLVLPSITKNVIPYNPHCDYFVHSYNKTHEAAGRSGMGGEMDPTEIFLLRDAVHAHNSNSATVNFLLETERQFSRIRKQLLSKLFTEKGPNGKLVYVPSTKNFPKSTVENIVKQWHSIQSAWQLMAKNEKLRGQNYTTVAVLRSDVVFVTPIQTQDYQKGITVPGFAKCPVNDRLVYGDRTAVEIWTNQRFDRMEKHVYKHLGSGIHPEKFLNWTIFPAIRAAHFPITEHPSICLLRARADDVLWANDCYNPPQERRKSVVSSDIKATYKNKNMKELVEKTLGRPCLGKGKKWNSEHRDLKCPTQSTTSAGKEQSLTYEKFFRETKFSPPPLPNDPRAVDACLVHVGKAAGSTIACVVGNIELPSCLPGSKEMKGLAVYRNSSKLANILRKTGARKNWKHVQGNRCKLNPEYDHILAVTTRDPVSRLMSAFNYERKLCYRIPPKGNLKGCKDIYDDCYKDFEQLAVEGLKEFSSSKRFLPSKSSKMTCPQRAMAFVSGSRQFWQTNHHWNNYEYYFPQLLQGQPGLRNDKLWGHVDVQPIDLAMDSLPTSRVVALRNEMLAQDWDAIDVMLGGTGSTGQRLFNTTLNASTKQALSEGALSYLCEALCMEIQYYKLMLWWSSNLNATDIEESMDILRQSCPKEPSSIRRCSNLPKAGRYNSQPEGRYHPDWHSVGEGKPRLKPL